MLRTIQVSLPPLSAPGYQIHIGPSASAELWTLQKSDPATPKLAIVTDETVARLHLAALLKDQSLPPTVITLPPGEPTKSLTSVVRIYDALAAQRFERSDLLVAFGGGVIGDLTGFVAATWLRGVRFVQIPTTLEAAIDAAVGGKTGVNHAAAKNLIGAFHQPTAVFVDLGFLRTLPPRDFAAGLAESVKHAATLAADFLDWHEAEASAILSRDEAILGELIARNCTLKAAVVAADERESGRRAVLNHGHTIGHAIEHCFQFELRHGECVALGMIVENEIARQRGLLPSSSCERVAALLHRLGLPLRLPRPVNAAALLAATRMDKKNRGGAVGYVLLRRLATPVTTTDVTDAEVLTALAAVQTAPT